ncbi:WD40-repeat-containing domain protein [Suillus lakei]|nr:WD40-repeat-containing domain protein [Suillus lakei]
MSSSTRKKQQRPVVTPHQIIRGHTGWVNDVVRLPGGRRIITCSDDGSLRLWDMESGAHIGEDWTYEVDIGEDCPGGPVLITEAEKTAAYTIALSPNGKTVVSGGSDEKVRLWDIETGKAGLEDLLLPIPDSLKHSGATRRPPVHARQIPPGFFDGAQSSARGTHPHSPPHDSRSARTPSSVNPHALLEYFSSLFRHAQSNNDGATELQQRPSRTICSRRHQLSKLLHYWLLLRGRENCSHTQPAGTTTPVATPAQSRPISWWAHIVLLLCCASPRQATQTQQQQQGQSQGPVQS